MLQTLFPTINEAFGQCASCQHKRKGGKPCFECAEQATPGNMHPNHKAAKEQ